MTEALRQHLAQPENRVRYALANSTHSDAEFAARALEQALCWIARCDDAEAHY